MSSPVSRRHLSALVVMFPLAGCAYFAWRAVFEAAMAPGASIFLFPLVLFSLVGILFSIGSALFKEKSFAIVASLVVLLPSLLFALSFTHFLFVSLGVLLAYISIRRVQGELEERMKIAFTESVTLGLTVFVFGICLVLSSQYYEHIRLQPWEELVPNFNVAEGTGAHLLQLASPFYPPLRTLENEQTTVDTFFLEMQGDTETKKFEIPEAYRAELERQGVFLEHEAFEKELEATALAQHRHQLSQLLGREVSGEEKMSNVLSEVLRQKVINMMNGTRGERVVPVPVIPVLLSVLLFLTVYPLGTLLLPWWATIAAVLFYVIRRSGGVTLEKSQVERERII